MKFSLYLFIAFLVANVIKAQPTNYKSTVQEQSEFYSKLNMITDAEFDNYNKKDYNLNKLASPTATCVLNKKIFGWHPYWMGSAYTNYQWNLLSDLCYFDYTVSSTTGNNTNASFAWNTASVVTVAKNNGTKIHICATMFSGHSTFWATPSAQTTFINNIVSLLNTRQGNGVNIDFEGMGASDKAPFVTFITNLRTALNTANPNYQLSICLYAVEWSSVFNIPALNPSVNFYTIMGYDYYYGGSSQAGPTSPLYNFQTSYNYTVGKSISYYMKQGAPANKLVMGLPYYGREWGVTSNVIPATTNTYNTSRTIDYVSSNPTTYSTSNKFWEGNCYSPYYAYQTGGQWRQCFIDDVYSLGRKYDMVNQRGIAGIGMWALGYDDGLTGYWNLIKDKFSNCAPIVCNDSLFDMGGPTRNYYDNETYAFTLSAPTGSMVQLQFKSFGVELNYDSLWLYNGASINSPLIGAYTGTNSPGTVTSTATNLTLRFKSDNATTTFGFKAIKSCVAPTNTVVITQLQYNSAIENFVNVYPNPSSNQFSVSSDKLIKQVVLYDYSGKLVKEISVNSENALVPVKELGNGIYFLKLFLVDDTIRNRKIVVQK